jgi:magnesium transporter
MNPRTRTPAPTQALAKANVSQRQIAHAGLTWLDMIQPGVPEVSYLRERFAFDSLTLEDVLSKIQRPKLDVYAEGEYLFIVLQFPVFDARNRRTSSSEVDLFVGPDYLVTLHEGDLKPLRRMFAAVNTDEQARAQLLGRGPGYLLYRIIDALVRYCFPMLYRIDDQIARIETHIFDRNARETIQELALVQRDSIAVRRIIKPNLPVIRVLAARERAFLQLDAEIYFGDVADAMRKLQDMLEEQHEILDGLNTTSDSLISQRISEVLKLLTVIAVVLLPILVVTSIYGLNLDLPVAQHPFAFGLIVLVMFGSAAGMIAYLRYKDWI